MRRRIVTAWACALLSIGATAAGDGTDASSALVREAAVALPGGPAKLVLVQAWGRAPRSSKPWRATGNDLPMMVSRTGEGWCEVAVKVKPKKDENIRLYQFDLDLSGAPDWQDTDGSRTLLRRGPTWRTAAALLSKQEKFPARWAWPVGGGRVKGIAKSEAAYAASGNDAWTGFSASVLFFKGQPRTLDTVDVPAVVRVSRSGNVLGLVAEYGLAVGFDGPGRLRVCPLLRSLQGGSEYTVRVRVFWGDGGPAELADRWTEVMDRRPLRVLFAGDSVGAARGSYAFLAMARLQKEFAGRVRTMNTSRGGATTKEFLSVWRPRVLDYNPNIVVFQLCYNDVGRIKPAQVAANLKTMIDSLLAKPGGRAVVLTPLSYDKKRVDATMKKGTDINKVHTEEYIPALRNLVADYDAEPATRGKVAFVDIWHAMARVRAEKGADHVLLPDGSHPNAEGNAVILEALWPALKRLADSSIAETADQSDVRLPAGDRRA